MSDVDVTPSSGNVFKDLGLDVYEEVKAERRRQIEVEGWDAQHDDYHDGGELARHAAAYAWAASLNETQRELAELDYTGRRGWFSLVVLRRLWRWADHWWKPTTPRRDLVKAAALIVAEIERLDRLEARNKAEAA